MTDEPDTEPMEARDTDEPQGEPAGGRLLEAERSVEPEASEQAAVPVEVASEPAATLATDAELDDAAALMAKRYMTHILAIDPGSGAPAGVLSTFDLVAILGGWEPRLARVLRPAPARPSPSARTLSEAKVSDVMHAGLATCTPDVSLSIVARTMAEHRVHCVSVSGIDTTGPRGQHFSWGLIEDIEQGHYFT